MINFTEFELKPGTFKTLPSEGAVKYWAGMPEEKKKLEDIVQSVRSDDLGQSEFVIMCSAWGGGKTHAIGYFASKINEQDDSYAFVASEILHGHKTTFLGLFHYLIGKHKNMLPKLVAHVKSAVEAEITLARETAKYTDIKGDENYRKKIIEDVVARDENADLINKFYELPPDSNVDSIVSILTDRKVVVDDSSASSMLATLVGVMTSSIGEQPALYKAVYVILDEMDAALDLKANDLFSFFAALRQLINGTADSYCGVLLAFTAETARLEVQLAEFLWERKTRDILEFEHLDNDAAKQFVLDYLKENRTGDTHLSQPFFPFSEDAILCIMERISDQIVPRNLLRAMGRVFERAARNGKIAPGEEIPRDIAEEILSEVNS